MVSDLRANRCEGWDISYTVTEARFGQLH